MLLPFSRTHTNLDGIACHPDEYVFGLDVRDSLPTMWGLPESK